MSQHADERVAERRKRRISCRTVDEIIAKTIELASSQESMKLNTIYSGKRYKIENTGTEISTECFDCPYCVKCGFNPTPMEHICKEDYNARKRLIEHLKRKHLAQIPELCRNVDNGGNACGSIEPESSTVCSDSGESSGGNQDSAVEHRVTIEEEIDAYEQVRQN